MINRLRQIAAFAVYHFTIVGGILLLPFALALGHVGVTLPVHRLITGVTAATEPPAEN